MKIVVRGVDRVVAGLAAIVAREVEATPDAVEQVLQRVARQEKTLLSLGWHERGTPTGSAPGSPPWRISGALMGSVFVEPARPSGAFSWSGRVGPTSRYGRIHELGGNTGRGHRTYLPPRPHLAPAWRIVRPSVPSVFRGAWNNAL